MLNPESCALVVIDLQERLMPAIGQGEAVAERCLLLARAAKRLGIPVIVTEENPEGLGPTIGALSGLPDRIIAKRAFDGAAEPELPAALGGRRQILACGCEAHVCVLQTVLGLRGLELEVSLAVDAVGSRRAEDKAVALKRMENHGVAAYTAEMAVFEWLRSCDHPRFKEILALVR